MGLAKSENRGQNGQAVYNFRSDVVQRIVFAVASPRIDFSTMVAVMKLPSFALLASSVLAGSMLFYSAREVEAQLVRVTPFGGVSVRLPFVSVDTLPYGGGARVRAPFTAVNTGLYGPDYYGPAYGHAYGYVPRSVLYGGYAPYRGYSPYLGYAPYRGYDRYPDYLLDGRIYQSRGHVGVSVGPTSPYLPGSRSSYERQLRIEALADAQRDLIYRAARPNYDTGMIDALSRPPSDPVAEVSLRLRQSAARLSRSLSAMGDQAEGWLEYLKPELIVDVIDGLEEESAVEQLSILWTNYEGTAGNPDLTQIWSLEGFRQTHDGLLAWLDIQQGIVETSTMQNETYEQPAGMTGSSPSPGASSFVDPSNQIVPLQPVSPTILESPLDSPDFNVSPQSSVEDAFEELPPGAPRASL